MLDARSYPLLVGLIVLVWFSRPAHAFGAGNIAGISKIEGQNCEPVSNYLLLAVDADRAANQGATATLKMRSSPSRWPAP